MKLEASERILRLLKFAASAQSRATDGYEIVKDALESGNMDEAQVVMLTVLGEELHSMNMYLAALAIGIFGLDETEAEELMPEPRPPLGFNIPGDFKPNNTSTRRDDNRE